MASTGSWDPEKAHCLYLQGKNDSEIAAALGVSAGKVRYWRKTENLPGNRRARFDTDEARRLFTEGWTDQAIADHYAISKHAVLNWRKREKLASAQPADSTADTQKMQKMYDAGESDIAIARECGVPDYTVAAWRREQGLEANRRLHLDAQKILALHKDGLSDPQIAGEIGCSPQTILRFRREHGLPANNSASRQYNGGGHPAWDRQKARRLYDQGLNDREIAQELGVAHSTIGAWRRTENLRPHGTAGRPKRRRQP